MAKADSGVSGRGKGRQQGQRQCPLRGKESEDGEGEGEEKKKVKREKDKKSAWVGDVFVKRKKEPASREASTQRHQHNYSQARGRMGGRQAEEGEEPSDDGQRPDRGSHGCQSMRCHIFEVVHQSI